MDCRLSVDRQHLLEGLKLVKKPHGVYTVATAR
jgi:hypothetical protein